MSDQLQTVIFAVLIILAAWWMHSETMKNIAASAKEAPCDCRYSLLAGFGVGVVTGIVGVGGGFLIVPLLLMLGVGSYQKAVAHSLVLIIPTSLVAALRYNESIDMAWYPVVMMTALAAIGVWAGNVLMRRYSSEHFQKGFSVMLVLLATWMFIKVAHNL